MMRFVSMGPLASKPGAMLCTGGGIDWQILISFSDLVWVACHL